MISPCYHNDVLYPSYEAAASAAAVAARSGEPQSVVRASDSYTWKGFFRRWDPEFQTALQAKVANAPAPVAPVVAASSAPASDPRLDALLVLVADLAAQVARLSAPKGRKAPKSKGSTAQTLPDDPLGF